jgi:hypothetical protein
MFGVELLALRTRRSRMTQQPKQQRTPKEQKPPRRPSHEKVVENLDKWANSPGLQPPK